MTGLYAIKVPKTLAPDVGHPNPFLTLEKLIKKVFERLLTFLEPESQARIRRFYHQEDAIRRSPPPPSLTIGSLFGRIAPIWYLLDTGILPRAFLPFLKFGEEGKGKPIIVSPDPIRGSEL
jgi:hypothetical protein